MAFVKEAIKMKRLKMLFAAAFACMALASCNSGSDNAVFRELLIEAVWHYEKAAPENGVTGYYFSFGKHGIVSIFPVTTYINPGTDHFYIYDPGKESLAIEEYGIFEVRDIDTDKLVLANGAAEYTLKRIKEEIDLPVSEKKP